MNGTNRNWTLGLAAALAIFTGCGGGGGGGGLAECGFSEDCDDGSACTKDICSGGKCFHEVDQTPVGCEQACNESTDCDDLDDCTLDICASNVCAHDPIDNCLPGPAAGRIDLFVQTPDARTFVDGSFAFESTETDFLTADEASLANIPLGSCVDEVFGQPPQVTELSAGNLQITDGTTTLLDLAPGTSNTYDSAANPLRLVFGSAFDLELTGSADIDAQTFPGAIKVPQVATFTGLGFAGADIITSPTFNYTPVAADHFWLLFQYFTGTGVVSLICAVDPNGTSFTMDAAHYNAIPNGSVQVRWQTATLKQLALRTPTIKRSVFVDTFVSKGGSATKQ